MDYSQKTNQVEFPKVLEHINSDDAKFETVVSNNNQKLILYNNQSTKNPSLKNRIQRTIILAVYNADQEVQLIDT